MCRGVLRLFSRRLPRQTHRPCVACLKRNYYVRVHLRRTRRVILGWLRGKRDASAVRTENCLGWAECPSSRTQKSSTPASDRYKSTATTVLWMQCVCFCAVITRELWWDFFLNLLQVSSFYDRCSEAMCSTYDTWRILMTSYYTINTNIILYRILFPPGARYTKANSTAVHGCANYRCVCEHGTIIYNFEKMKRRSP